MKNDPMGDRMKRYEAATKLVLPRRTYTILRLDGRAFHTVTRGLQRPYDEDFQWQMTLLAMALCREVSGSCFAYVQSDEISILMQDFESLYTQPWFDGEVQKIVSVAASFAGANFPTSGAHFDARVFTIPDPVEVANYFIWRQRDCARNAVLAYAQHELGHRAIQGLNTKVLGQMLADKGIEIPVKYSNGMIVDKDYVDHGDGTRRSFWTKFVAPPLNCEPGQYLSRAIPPLPTLLPEVDVPEHAEGEDGDADAKPAVPETEPQAEAVADAHSSGDQVQNDLDEAHGRPTPPMGGVMAW